jgi:hypothetical protein
MWWPLLLTSAFVPCRCCREMTHPQLLSRGRSSCQVRRPAHRRAPQHNAAHLSTAHCSTSQHNAAQHSMAHAMLRPVPSPMSHQPEHSLQQRDVRSTAPATSACRLSDRQHARWMTCHSSCQFCKQRGLQQHTIWHSSSSDNTACVRSQQWLLQCASGALQQYSRFLLAQQPCLLHHAQW